MSNDTTGAGAGNSSDIDPLSLLPPYLDLPPHLSAHKYFFVCTLTVAAWDTLVLSPRTWKLLRQSPGWPPLKIAFYFLRLMMPIEFIIVAVAFFDIHWTREMCQRFFLFEPILTAILVSICSAVHLIRIRAIYNKSQQITSLLTGLLLAQVCMMAVACGFFHVVPVDDPSQGCIAGPKHNWVGIYWVGPSLFFSTTFALALARSFQSRAQRPIGLWKLMLRDGLNLYGAVWIVNMVNMLFWFIVTPTGPEDTIKTIVTSMAAVLTITMSMRIILSVKGTLVGGGSFAGSASAPSTSHSGSHSHSRGGAVATGPHGVRSGTGTTGAVFSINPASQGGRGQTYTLDEMRSKPEQDWDGKSSLNGGVPEAKTELVGDSGELQQQQQQQQQQHAGVGVQVTVERHAGY